MRTVKFLAIAAGFLLMAETAWAETFVAAHIAGIRHPTRNSVITRKNQRIRITYWAELCNGDYVIAGDPGAQVTIHYVDGRKDVVLNGGDRAYPVFSNRPVASERGNFVAAAIEDLVRKPWAHPRSTRTRGEKTELAIFIEGVNDGKSVILAGERHPVLQWQGGTPPYNVVIRAANGNAVLDEKLVWAGKDSLSHRLLITKHAVLFTPGEYKLVITDHNDTKVEGAFHAVEAGIPPAPDEADPLVASLTGGAALAATRDPRYALEAMFRLSAALDAGWSAADAVADAIAKPN